MKGLLKSGVSTFLLLSLSVFSVSAYELTPGRSVVNEENICQQITPQNTATYFDSESLHSGKNEIIILELPDPQSGVLLCGDNEVLPYQTISAQQVKKLSFLPNQGYLGEAGFLYRISGDNTATILMKLHVTDGEIAPPESADQTVTTIKNISVTGTFNLPENTTVKLEDAPKKGEVVIEGSQFSYTPAADQTGSDRFHFTVVDSYGQCSKPATVKIKIEKPAFDLVYTDLAGSYAELPAVQLTELGVMGGEQIAGQSFFEPERTVNKGDFLAMAMKASNYLPADSALGDARSALTEGYFVEALSTGLLTDHEVNQLKSSEPISRADAAVVLAKLLPESGGAAASSFTDELPQYAAQSIAKLQNLGILYGYGDGSFRPSNMLTKAECAAMLQRMVNYNEQHTGSFGLLSWFF